ncbi:MAG: hypothetical protein EP330_23190 [Deltaproteobacteria bacterium]|nr:MAG: hypothetical protein EP330_23190 [Deltaproteobacteria bacterium]
MKTQQTQQTTAPTTAPSAPSPESEETSVSNSEMQEQLSSNGGGGSGPPGPPGGPPNDSAPALGGDPSSLAEIRQMNMGDVSRYPTSPSGRLKPVLQGALSSNWFHAIDGLVFDKWSDDSSAHAEHPEALQELMKRMLLLREWDTEATLKATRAVLEQRPDAGGKKGEDILEWGSAGSDALTSDIDINLKGRFNQEAVGLFNKKHLERGWSFESGIVYDVNVYAKDFMHAIEFEQTTDTTATIVPQSEVELDEEAKAEDSRDQEIWTLVKTRRYMSEGEWESYTVQICEGDEDGSMAVMVREAEIRFAQYKQEMVNAVAHDVVKANEAVAQLVAAKSPLSEHHMSESVEMAAANRVYEAKLSHIIELRTALSRLAAIQDPSPSDRKLARDTALELRHRLSEAALYANEAYVSDGAVNHVVVGMQMAGSSGFRDKQKKKGNIGQGTEKLDIRLPDDKLFHSFQEQVADALKEIGKHPEIGEAMLKGGKYVQRMADAARRLPGAAGLTRLKAFEDAGTDFIAAKKNDNLSFDEKYAAVRQAAKARLGIDDPGALRAALIEFGVDVRKAFKAATTPQAPETQPTENQEQPEVVAPQPNTAAMQQALAMVQGITSSMNGTENLDTN